VSIGVGREGGREGGGEDGGGLEVLGSKETDIVDSFCSGFSRNFRSLYIFTPPSLPPSDTNTCNAFLNAVSCPVALQVNQGCTVPGDLTTFVNQCSCGGIDGSLEARNSIIELVTPVKEVNALTVYEKGSTTYLQFCPTFSNLCGSFLDDIACPEALRVNVGCLNKNDYRSYKGQCQCGGVDAGDRVRRLVVDAHIGPKIAMISDSFVFTDGKPRGEGGREGRKGRRVTCFPESRQMTHLFLCLFFWT
jgi:hypothetical protein